MERLEYRIEIEAPAKIVFDTMLAEDTYAKWVAKSWPDSSYEGKWAKGEKIKFIGVDGSGILAEVTDLKPNERVVLTHTAVLNPGGVEDRTSEAGKNWAGITESYFFSEHGTITSLLVVIETPEKWRAMFDEGWPTALEELKKLAENAAVHQ